MPLPPQVLPGRAFQQVDRKSRLLFHWRAADLSLTPVTGQAPTFARAAVGGLVLDANGRLHGAAHSEPNFEMYDLDGDGAYETPGLLVTRAQTNDATFATDFANAAWTKGNITVSSDAWPRGPANGKAADLLLETAASSTHALIRSLSISAGAVCVWAVLLRGAGRTKARLYIDSDAAANRCRAVLDVAAGTVTQEANVGTGTIRSSGVRPLDDDFFLAWMIGTVDPAATSASFRVAFLDGASSESYAGDTTRGFHIAGAFFAQAATEFQAMTGLDAAAAEVASLLSYANAVPTALADAYTLYVELARPSGFDYVGTMADGRYLCRVSGVTPQLNLSLLSGAARTLRANFAGASGNSLCDLAVPAGRTVRACAQAYDLRTAPKVRLDVGAGWGVVGTGAAASAALGNGTVHLGSDGTANNALGGGLLCVKFVAGQYTPEQMRNLF